MNFAADGSGHLARFKQLLEAFFIWSLGHNFAKTI